LFDPSGGFLQQLRILLEYVLSDAKAELTKGEFLEEAHHRVLELIKRVLDVLGDTIDRKYYVFIGSELRIAGSFYSARRI